MHDISARHQPSAWAARTSERLRGLSSQRADRARRRFCSAGLLERDGPVFATVPMLLTWDEVNDGLDPRDHTIVTAAARMAALGTDPVHAVLEMKPDLGGALARLAGVMAQATRPGSTSTRATPGAARRCLAAPSAVQLLPEDRSMHGRGFRVLIGMAAVSLNAAAQGVPFSQHGTVSQRVSHTDIAIEYNRPVARGRTLFGALAVGVPGRAGECGGGERGAAASSFARERGPAGDEGGGAG